MTERERLLEIRALIRDFKRRCDDEEYTDVDDVWNLLYEIRALTWKLGPPK